MAHIAKEESQIREMLGQWVSELEPVVIRTLWQIKGLGFADDSTATVVVANPEFIADAVSAATTTAQRL